MPAPPARAPLFSTKRLVRTPENLQRVGALAKLFKKVCARALFFFGFINNPVRTLENLQHVGALTRLFF